MYVLRCADGSYYSGHTDNLIQRLAQHEAGAIPTCYTVQRRPVALVYPQEFSTRQEALTAKLQIKGWNRKKQQTLIRGDWNQLAWLANPRNRKLPL